MVFSSVGVDDDHPVADVGDGAADDVGVVAADDDHVDDDDVVVVVLAAAADDGDYYCDLHGPYLFQSG